MYSEDYDGAYAQERQGEDVYSKPVRDVLLRREGYEGTE